MCHSLRVCVVGGILGDSIGVLLCSCSSSRPDWARIGQVRAARTITLFFTMGTTVVANVALFPSPTGSGPIYHLFLRTVTCRLVLICLWNLRLHPSLCNIGLI